MFQIKVEQKWEKKGKCKKKNSQVQDKQSKRRATGKRPEKERMRWKSRCMFSDANTGQR